MHDLLSTTSSLASDDTSEIAIKWGWAHTAAVLAISDLPSIFSVARSAHKHHEKAAEKFCSLKDANQAHAHS